MQPQEARLHSRSPFVQKVSVIPSGATAPLRLWSSNLSEGGLCLQTAQPFRRGDRLGVRLECNGTEVHVPVAEVAWVLRDVKGSSRAPGVGLRFVDVAAEDRKLIRRVVTHLGQASTADTLPPLAASTPGEPSLAAEDSLPPAGAPISIHGREDRGSELPADASLPPAGPSLGPLPAESADANRWEFSEGGAGDSMIVARHKRSGFAVAAGLLAAGTLTGMLFGVLNQSGRTPPPKPEVVALAPEPAPVEEAAPAPEPVDAAPAPVAAAPAPAPVKRPAPAKTETTLASARLHPAALVETPQLPLPTRKQGHMVLGAVASQGKDVVLPIRGARKVERHFALQDPPRVVLDLTTDGYDGPLELPGKGGVSKVRVGRRPGGVRVVVEVKTAALAKGYKLNGTPGSYAVTLAAR